MPQKYRFVLRAQFPAVYPLPEGGMTEDVLFRSDPIIAQADNASILIDWAKRMTEHPLIGQMVSHLETEMITGRDEQKVWVTV